MKLNNQKNRHTQINNFRDLAKFNPRLKENIIFRSAALCIYQNEITLSEFLTIKGISTIIDLRADRELEELNYNSLNISVDIIHAPFDPWKQSQKFKNNHNAGSNAEIAYHFFSLECKKSIKLVVEAILNANRAINIHCHAGKDRTGIIVALLYLLSGANKETILIDYLASEMDTKSSYIEILINTVQQSGGIKAYLESCDLSANQIGNLKNKIMR